MGAAQNLHRSAATLQGSLKRTAKAPQQNNSPTVFYLNRGKHVGKWTGWWGHLGVPVQRGIVTYESRSLSNAPLRASFARVLPTCVAVRQVKPFTSSFRSALATVFTTGARGTMVRALLLSRQWCALVMNDE